VAASALAGAATCRNGNGKLDNPAFPALGPGPRIFSAGAGMPAPLSSLGNGRFVSYSHSACDIFRALRPH